MTMSNTPDSQNKDQEFEHKIQEQSPSLPAEFWLFLKDNKKWWLLPMIIVLLLVGALVILGGSTAAPFIYTLF